MFLTYITLYITLLLLTSINFALCYSSSNSNTITTRSIISTHYFYENNTYYYLLYLGYPGAKLYVPISLSSQHTTIKDILFPKNNTYSIKAYDSEIIRTKNFKEIRADKLCDNIINNKNAFTIHEFCFYSIPSYIYNTMPNEHEGLAFAFHIPNKNFSLIHQLNTTQQIDKAVFAFIPPLDYNEQHKTKGLMFYGGIDLQYLNNKTYYTVCSSIKTATAWGCVLDYIYIDNVDDYNSKHNKKTFGNMYYSIFQTSEAFILAPELFLKFFLEYVISVNGQCVQVKDKEGLYIQCDTNTVMNKLKSIDFQFEHSMFRFKSYELFICDYNSNECIFKIRYHESNAHLWTIGAAFLDKYATVFDYENASITFYSDEWIDINNRSLSITIPHNDVSLSSYAHIKRIIIFNITILLIINILIIIYSKHIYI